MTRFLECARTGAHATASTGETACFKLTGYVRKVADLLADVDAGLKDEFFDILRAAAWPETRAAVLKAINNIKS